MRFILFLVLAISSFSLAQTDSLFLAKIERIQSQVLQEERILNVYAPSSDQSDTSNKFPVIYVLDGSANEDFIHIVGIVQFLVMSKQMKPCIVVGIANVDRKRDFTFPTSIEKDKLDFPTTGHSENFIRFIESECIPYVQEQYPTSEEKTLIGQSLGGLLASEVLLKKPVLFQHFLIVSPSFWWNNQSLLKEFKHKTNQYHELGTKVYLAVGNEHPMMVKDAKTYSSYLKNQLNHNNKQFEHLKKEDHGTILHQAVFNGLKWLYQETK